MHSTFKYVKIITPKDTSILLALISIVLKFVFEFFNNKPIIMFFFWFSVIVIYLY